MATLFHANSSWQVTIVYLVTSVEYIHQLAESFPLLEQNWLRRIHPRPSVTVFYTSNELVQPMMMNVSGLKGCANIVYIDESQPVYARDLRAQGRCLCCCNNQTNKQMKRRSKSLQARAMKGGNYAPDYCFMNRFRTMLMHHTHALAAFDYFVQMDTDTYISKPMPYDPIERMRSSQAIWGYLKHEVRPTTAEDCNEGMYEAIDAYVARLQVSTSILPAYLPPRGTTYQGAFNIGDLNFLRFDAKLRAFLRWINEDETGIWTHRWGDQAFLPNAIGLSKPASAVLRFSDLLDDQVITHRSKSLGRLRCKLNPSCRSQEKMLGTPSIRRKVGAASEATSLGGRKNGIGARRGNKGRQHGPAGSFRR